jgi:group I intron endonuclease
MKTKISGIYKIINTITGKYYVGSSKNIYHRWYEHRLYLNKNSHDNDKLQNAWNKHGSDSFDFIIIETLHSDKTLLLNVEQKYLDIARQDSKNCYNLNFLARGVEFTDDIKRKIGESSRGRKHSRETIEKIINSNKTRIYDEATREKLKMVTSGKNNYRYDPTIYKFLNKNTNETFIGTMYEMRSLYGKNLGSGLYEVIRGTRKHAKGWIVSA